MFGAWKANLYWLVFSVGLSVILWMVITGQQNPYREDVIQNVPVEIQNIPPSIVVNSPQPMIAVRISAPQDDLPSIQASKLKAYADATTVTAGQQNLPVKVESTDWRVRVDTWEPSTVGVQFEAAKKKDVEVKANVSGEVPFGFAAGTPTISPQTVTVSGPDSLVSEVAQAIVDVRLQDARSRINKQVTPMAVDDQGNEVKGVTVTPGTVTLDVPIDQQVTYKTVPIDPKLVGSVAFGYKVVGVMVEPSTVTVVGDANTLRDVSVVSTSAIDLTGANGDITMNTGLDLPSAVSLVRQQTIAVRVYVESSDGSQTMMIAPTVTDLEEGLSASYQPTSVQVTVSGPIPVLNTLKAQDVQVELSAAGLVTGTAPVSPTVKLPDVVRLERVVPDKVSVTIK